MNDLELRLTELLAGKADEADVSPADGFAEYPYTTALGFTEQGSVTKRREPAPIGFASTSARTASNRPGRQIAQGILAVACAAAVVAVVAVVVVSRDDEATTVDAPVPPAAVGPLEEPSPDEDALARNTDLYVPGSGPSGVTAAGRYVELRGCRPLEENPGELCDGSEGWAYVTGSVDTPELHYGLLGIVDNPVLSPLDDRYFVASGPSSSTQDPPSAGTAWLIDSVTGQRGALTWQEQPTTLDPAQQELVMFPVPHLAPDNYRYPDPRSLPRVVDKRDWTIRPLNVPEDASSVVAIHQPGSGRIWIGTAPDGGDFGLAYTDDGGASWTDVELPESLRLTGEALLQGATTLKGRALVVAAAGDHVAVTARWDSDPGELFVSADAGGTWDSIALDPIYGNGRGLFVLSDDRLLLVSSRELGVGSGRDGAIVSKTLRVSSSASDWTQLERSTGRMSEVIGTTDIAVEVNQQRIIVAYDAGGPSLFPRFFSTDLNNLWSIGDPHWTG